MTEAKLEFRDPKMAMMYVGYLRRRIDDLIGAIETNDVLSFCGVTADVFEMVNPQSPPVGTIITVMVGPEVMDRIISTPGLLESASILPRIMEDFEKLRTDMEAHLESVIRELEVVSRGDADV